MLENDWFCDSGNSKFLQDSLEIMEDNPSCAFVKLRAFFDKDDFGHGKLEYSPWSVEGGLEKLSKGQTARGSDYFIASPEFSGFTLNPILARGTFLGAIQEEFVNDDRWENPLRSGEEGPSRFWRNQTTWTSALLPDGPYRHIGFYSLYDKSVTLTKYFVRYCKRMVKIGSLNV